MMSIQSTSVPSLSIRQCSAATLQAVEHAPGIIQAGATFAAGSVFLSVHFLFLLINIPKRKLKGKAVTVTKMFVV